MTQDYAIEARNIGVSFKVDGGMIEAVKDVSFTLQQRPNHCTCGGIRLWQVGDRPRNHAALVQTCAGL